jgi:ribonucleoside-diphosphate reductase alpha chain
MYTPFYWLNQESRDFLAKGYLLPGQSPEDRIRFIADRAEQHLAIPGYADKFYNYMSRGWFSLSSPVWSNYGLGRGLPVSCFGGYVPDSTEGILYTHAEQGMLSKLGGGTSLYFGDVRHRGAPITDNGESNGVVPFIRMMDTMTDVISQGSTRRGYMAVYLPIDHPDIGEFLEIGSDGNEIQGIMTGVNVSDNWLKSMTAGDSNKRTLWAKLLRKRSEHGYPYIFFTDNVNNHKPECYKDTPILASNLCVTGNTKVLTRDGYKLIESLSDTTVDCWNGTSWSPTPIFQTSKGQEVLEVTLSNGHTIKATPYHKWYVVKQDTCGKLVGEEMKRTFELQPNDKLIKYSLSPVDHGTLELPNAYDNGFHTADGIVYKDTNCARISLYGERRKLVDRFNNYKSITTDSNDRINVIYSANVLLPKFFVPDTTYSVASRLSWLAGLLDGEGTLINSNGTESIQLVSINREFLRDLQLFLQELGVDANIYLSAGAEYRKLPANDGTGALKEFWCSESYRILIEGNYLNNLVSLGLPTSRVMPTLRDYNSQATQFVKIVSVIDNNEIEPTYCGTEPTLNRLMFNGVLTGNCSEIALPSSETETFTCVLSSLNLLHYDEWKDTDAVEVLTMFLDTVVQELINTIAIGKYSKFMDRVRNFAVNHRAIGLGVLGYSSYLMARSVPFESREAAKLNYEIFKLIRTKAEAASIQLGTTLGTVYGTNRRNTTLMAIAPTKSSSFILGQVSQGIEPLMSNYFVNNTAKTVSVYKNPYLVTLLQSKGQDTPTIWDSILNADGSVQHLPFLTDHEKSVFKTFPEINPESVIDQAAIRQEFIDQAQSINLMVPPTMAVRDVNALYLRAWSLGIKSLYYQFSLSAAQMKSRELSNTKECVACHA